MGNWALGLPAFLLDPFFVIPVSLAICFAVFSLIEWIASWPRAFKRWNTWRKYNRLDVMGRYLATSRGVDPETLIKRGLL